MNYSNGDKQAIINNGYVALGAISVEQDGVIERLTQDNYLESWKLEDFRYAPNEGVIGQFISKKLTGSLLGLPTNLTLENKEISVSLGIQTSDTINYYNYGTYIVSKVTTSDTDHKTTFEAYDYSMKFNEKFTPTINYPCTLLEFVNSICGVTGVRLESSAKVYTLAVPQEGLTAGNYSFVLDNEHAYNFTIATDLKYHSSILLDLGNLDATIHSVDADNNLTPITDSTVTITESASASGTVLEFHECDDTTIPNKMMVITSNQFEEGDLYRDCIKACAQISGTFARINENDKLEFDTLPTSYSNISQYDTIDINHYKSCKASDNRYGPVNKVTIGLKDIEGENATYESPSYTEDTACEIGIWNNPLALNEPERSLALAGVKDVLIGISYMPVELETTGQPWFIGNEPIQITNLDNEVFTTIPLDRTLEYKGYIAYKIVTTSTTQTTRDYTYDNSMSAKVAKTRVIVDREQKTINGIVETLSGEDGLVETVTNLGIQVDNISNIFQITGGSNLIKNSAFYFRDEVWKFTPLTENNSYHTELGQGYDGSLSGEYVSSAKIRLKNMLLESTFDDGTYLNNIVGLVIGTQYSFNCYLTQDEFTETTISLYNSDNILVKTITLTGAKTKKQVIFTAKATASNYKLAIRTTSSSTDNTGFVEIYDMMMNKGDVKEWEASSGEIYSTNVKFSLQGMSVTSTGSGYITHVTTDGFYIADQYGNNKFRVDTTGVSTNNIDASGYIATDDFVQEVRTINGRKHHLSYFRGGV